MVKLLIMTCLLVWQLLPGFCNRDLNRVQGTVHGGQINTCGVLSSAMSGMADDHSDIQKTVRVSRAETKDNNAGLFVTALCEIIR